MDSASSHPAVGQVLIAETLMEQYHRAAGALGAAEPDEFEVHVAEINRTYPSIWEHLDRARDALAAEGRDVALYDRLRAQVGETHNGFSKYETDGTQLDKMALLQGQIGTKKTIEYELQSAGMFAASEAAGALRNASLDLDWEGAAKQLDAMGKINVRSGGGAAFTIQLMAWSAIAAFCYLLYWIFTK